jgi:hypothetical protein
VLFENAMATKPRNLSVYRVSHHIFTTVSLNHIVATITLDTIISLSVIIAFVIPLVALLTSLPAMWRKEHLWNFCVPQREHFSRLVYC